MQCRLAKIFKTKLLIFLYLPSPFKKKKKIVLFWLNSGLLHAKQNIPRIWSYRCLLKFYCSLVLGRAMELFEVVGLGWDGGRRGWGRFEKQQPSELSKGGATVGVEKWTETSEMISNSFSQMELNSTRYAIFFFFFYIHPLYNRVIFISWESHSTSFPCRI